MRRGWKEGVYPLNIEVPCQIFLLIFKKKKFRRGMGGTPLGVTLEAFLVK